MPMNASICIHVEDLGDGREYIAGPFSLSGDAHKWAEEFTKDFSTPDPDDPDLPRLAVKYFEPSGGDSPYPTWLVYDPSNPAEDKSGHVRLTVLELDDPEYVEQEFGV